jgi:hypothetical protein
MAVAKLSGVHRDHHAMLVGERRDLLRGFNGRRGGDDLRAEGLGNHEPAIDFLIAEPHIRAVVEGPDANAGGVELLADRLEVIERRLDAPAPQILARFLALLWSGTASSGRRGFDLRRPQLAFGESTFRHALDERFDHVAARGARQFTQGICLHAELDSTDRLRPG